MRKKITAMLLMSLATTAAYGDDAAPAPETGPLAKQNFTGILTLTTDYVFRGISNTSNHPAAQAELDWNYNGFYLTSWSSNTDVDPAKNTTLEMDGYGGYRWTWAGIGFDAGGLYYGYPSVSGAPNALGQSTDIDYWEGKLALSKSFDGAFSPAVSLTGFVSPDFAGSDGTAEAVYGTLALSFPYGINFGGGVGYQNVDGDKTTGKANATAAGLLLPDGTPMSGYDYVWWNAGLNTDFHGLHFDVSYYDTNESDSLKTLYSGGGRSLIESRVVFTLSKAF